MPRQPFLNTREVKAFKGEWPKALPHIAVGGWKLAEERPEAMRLVGACLSLWPAVEIQMATLLAALMRADTDTAIAVYHSIRRSTGRQDAIEQAALHALDAKGVELLKAVLIYHSQIESERNALAHGQWGFSDLIRDGLAWIAFKHIINVHLDYNRAALGHARKVEQDFILKNAFVFRESDLRLLFGEMTQVIVAVNELRGWITAASGNPPSTLDAQAFDTLEAIAPVREALLALRRRAERDKTQ